MAIVNSTQYSNEVAVPPVNNPTHEMLGRIRFARFNHVQSGAGSVGDQVRTVRLPAGKVRLILPMSRIAFSALGAARTMDIGWEAYNSDDGLETVVAADPNGLDDGIDASSAGSVNPGGTVGKDETYLFESSAGVVIVLQINDDVMPDAGTLDGYFAFVID